MRNDTFVKFVLSYISILVWVLVPIINIAVAWIIGPVVVLTTAVSVGIALLLTVKGTSHSSQSKSVTNLIYALRADLVADDADLWFRGNRVTTIAAHDGYSYINDVDTDYMGFIECAALIWQLKAYKSFKYPKKKQADPKSSEYKPLKID